MDRDLAMLLLLGVLVSVILFFLALFAVAPIFTSCLVSLLYTLYVFISNESHGIHHAQEFENGFWTMFAILLSTALFFARDSPIAFGRWNPSLGFFGVLTCGYGMHIWDRYLHRLDLSRQILLKRGNTATASLSRLTALGIPIEDQLKQINSCLSDIDQLLIPSTVNHFVNQRFILRKEREIISIFEEAEQKALNYLILHSKLGLLFYKIKDHRNFSGQHRTELIELLAVERISQLHVSARVVVLHALQILKLPAISKAEQWVRNIILSTKQDDLSDLKTLMDAKGDYFCMKKLIFDDIRSENVRQDILKHIEREAKVQLAHMVMRTKKSKVRNLKAWRKVLSDVDDTLTCSGGSYPAGIDRRYGKKVVYPGVLAFYRELDLGAEGPDEWPPNTAGNLVFLSARPHLYKDVSEKRNFAKFEKLRQRKSVDGSSALGMHTIPSLLAGDLSSGKEFIFTNDFEPLAQKKYENFRQYVSIYPEFKHVFVCDNGQGDVRAGQLMLDNFAKQLEAVFVHVVQPISKTYKYKPEHWYTKGLKPFFFTTYPEAALQAVTQKPPLMKVQGVKRICQEAVYDFYYVQSNEWPSLKHKMDRREELNQAIWRCNILLKAKGEEEVPLIEAEQIWKVGQLVRTPYGVGRILSFDPIFDLYEVDLDCRPLDVQVASYKQNDTKEGVGITSSKQPLSSSRSGAAVDIRASGLPIALATVEEADDEATDSISQSTSRTSLDKNQSRSRSNSLVSLERNLSLSQSTSLEKLEGDRSCVDFVDNSTHKEYNTVAEPSEYIHRNESGGITVNALKQNVVSASSRKVLPKGMNEINASAHSFLKENKPKSQAELNTLIPFGHDRPRQTVRARLQGRCLQKFITPTLPIFAKSDENRQSFSFWEASKSSQQAQPQKKAIEIDILAKDSVIFTCFGEGKICQPPKKERASSFVSKDTKNSLYKSQSYQTIGISLTSWTLANKTHPILYCSVDNALKWKKMTTESVSKVKSTAGNNSAVSSRLLSKFGTIVSQLITGPADRLIVNGPSDKRIVNAPSVPVIKATAKYDRYFKDGAAVATPFGDGVVKSFRATDGFYEVFLVKWKLNGGKCPIAYLRRDNMCCRIAKGCHEGYPVFTSLGLSGKLVSVEPTTGVHMVVVSSAGLTCYLRPEDVIRPLKAAVGEDVCTFFGEGKVRRYRARDDMYEIALPAGATLYAKAENFDRVSDGLQDGESSYGVKWLLGLIFQGSSRSGGSQRSRSNSFASQTGTSRSHSSRRS